MRWTLLPAAILAFALAAPARAEDPPELALAKSVVEGLRGDEHREKMRIVWPEVVETTPPEGAEVVVITGYFDYVLTRFVWRRGKVEARSVAAAKLGFENPGGEGALASEFDVDPVEFATAWAAARLVLGARDERIDPEPEGDDDPNGGWWPGSHQSRSWVRLRLAGARTPLYVCEFRGMRWNREHVNRWHAIRDSAVFEVFESLRGDRPSRDSAVSDWRPYVTETIRDAATAPDGGLSGDASLPIELQIRVAGEVGDVDTAAALDALARRVERRAETLMVHFDLIHMITSARTQLGLRLRWDSEIATRVIRGRQGGPLRWVRARFLEEAPETYAVVLIEDLENPDLAPYDLTSTLADLRTLHPSDAAFPLRKHLDSWDPLVRARVCLALLAIDARDVAALKELLALAEDDKSHPTGRGEDPEWSRQIALDELVRLGVVSAKDLRARLRAPEVPSAAWIQLAIAGTKLTPLPLSDTEIRDAWRRVLDGSDEPDARVAIARLVDLGDVASRQRLLDWIDRVERECGVAAATWVASMRKRLADEMPAPPVPK